jgi:hypothetical protein
MRALCAVGLLLCSRYIRGCRPKLNSYGLRIISPAPEMQWRASVSALFPRSIVLRARRLQQRLLAVRKDSDNPYSPAASLALLLAVGVAVKFIH